MSALDAAFGFLPNTARWMSPDENREALLTMTSPFRSSHSMRAPGTRSRRRLTVAGTEICPFDVMVDSTDSMQVTLSLRD